MTSALRTSLAIFSFLALFACSKDKKTDADAAADTDAAVAAAVDAAPAADAAVATDTDAGDAAVAAVATATAIVGRPKPVPVDPPICVAARTARDRNSPAAAGLAAKCAAAGGKL